MGDQRSRTWGCCPTPPGGQQGTDLTARTSDTTLDHLPAVLVSNNPFGSWRMLDQGRRAGPDQGACGVIAARMASRGQAIGLLRRQQ